MTSPLSPSTLAAAPSLQPKHAISSADPPIRATTAPAPPNPSPPWAIQATASTSALNHAAAGSAAHYLSVWAREGTTETGAVVAAVVGRAAQETALTSMGAARRGHN